jgi:multimeric flavodoxin WrbA
MSTGRNWSSQRFRWTAAIAASDGFVFVTPKYNYGPSAVQKNMIDGVYPFARPSTFPLRPIWAHFQGGDVNKGLAELKAQAQTMMDDLLWWTTALKSARNAQSRNGQR